MHKLSKIIGRLSHTWVDWHVMAVSESPPTTLHELADAPMWEWNEVNHVDTIELAVSPCSTHPATRL